MAVGVIVPVWNSGRGASCGMEFRERFGDLNSFVLESLRGLDETIQYQRGKDREEEMVKKSRQLDRKQKIMKDLEGTQRGVTEYTDTPVLLRNAVPDGISLYAGTALF